MPTSSFDTFFACTIIVAAALIATGYVCSTMQTRIDNTKGINEQSYLQAIANQIVSSPGTPGNWGATDRAPTDFGLAASPSTIPYELDIDKVTRLNSLNSNALTYFEMETSTKLSNIALGISISPLMDVSLVQTGNHTDDGDSDFTFSVSTSVNSEPVSANLNCYTLADGFLSNVTSSTSGAGVGQVSVQIPTSTAGDALTVVFARSTIDERITSYAIYNFQNATQENEPNSSPLILSPLNYTLTYATNSSALAIQKGYALSYGYEQSLNCAQGSPIPRIVDPSPTIIIVNGLNDDIFFQQWVSYPQVPLSAGSDFSSTQQQSVFTYTVTINGAFYKLQITFGGVPSS